MSSAPYLLDAESHAFPPIEQALTEPNGLLAVGGDLSSGRLLSAYQHGIFPWFDENQPILWWSPNPRAVLFPEALNVSRSLRKSMRNRGYQVTYDQAFPAVIAACQTTPRGEQSGTWITEEMKASYTQLHYLGYAHSVECWSEGALVGGLYGLSIGKLFFGESMFSTKTDASKVAFAHLAQSLHQAGFPLIDCQISNPHLNRLGATTIPRKEFQHYLKDYLHCKLEPPESPWLS